MLNSQARQFGESLVERHVLSRDVLEDAIDESARLNLPLPTILLQRGLVGPKDLAAALCVALGMRFVDFDEIAGPAAGRAHWCPRRSPASSPRSASRSTHDSVLVAFADPADHAALDEVSTAIHAETGLHRDPRRRRAPGAARRDRARVRPDRRRDRAAARRRGHRPRAAPDVRAGAGDRRAPTSTSRPASRRSCASSATCTGSPTSRC